MSVKNYDRLKEPGTNVTGMDLTYRGSELPTAPAALVAGTSGDAEIFVDCDADESAGVDVQALYKVKLTPVISAATPGTQSLKVEVTPVNGDASDAPTITNTIPHPEAMDAWQAAAGRARQA